MTYAVLRSRDPHADCWRGLSGVGRHGEEPIEAARRHAWRHAGVPVNATFLELETAAWENDGARSASEYAFAALVDPAELQVPDEHELCWVAYDVANRLLQRDPERRALWELRRRIAGAGT
jgi:ADP-ribose pyrophosphatase YjhB (NUDIX family)